MNVVRKGTYRARNGSRREIFVVEMSEDPWYELRQQQCDANRDERPNLNADGFAYYVTEQLPIDAWTMMPPLDFMSLAEAVSFLERSYPELRWDS